MIAHMLKSITFVSAANFAWTAGERKRRLSDGKVTRVIMFWDQHRPFRARATKWKHVTLW
ncbi:MAG: hypothetical protein ACI91Z_000163 [Yoonia sp.]|jgi:hypothetical protein